MNETAILSCAEMNVTTGKDWKIWNQNIKST